MLKNNEFNEIQDNNDNDVHIQIREEQLDISKKKIPLSRVNIHKEIVTEEKTITVPVKREELVIEKTPLTLSSSNEIEGNPEIIRITLSEEHVDINKHMVQLEEVSINNHTFEEIEHINELLKKEKLNIKVNGNAKIINKGAY